jgi:hypothetical protein
MDVSGVEIWKMCLKRSDTNLESMLWHMTCHDLSLQVPYSLFTKWRLTARRHNAPKLETQYLKFGVFTSTNSVVTMICTPVQWRKVRLEEMFLYLLSWCQYMQFSFVALLTIRIKASTARAFSPFFLARDKLFSPGPITKWIWQELDTIWEKWSKMRKWHDNWVAHGWRIQLR